MRIPIPIQLFTLMRITFPGWASTVLCKPPQLQVFLFDTDRTRRLSFMQIRIRRFSHMQIRIQAFYFWADPDPVSENDPYPPQHCFLKRLPIKIIIEPSFAASCQSTSSGAPDASRTTTPPSAATMSGSTRSRPGAVRPAIRLVSLFRPFQAFNSYSFSWNKVWQARVSNPCFTSSSFIEPPATGYHQWSF